MAAPEGIKLLTRPGDSINMQPDPSRSSQPAQPSARAGAEHYASGGAPREGNRPPDLRTAVHDLRNVVAPLRNAVQLLRLRGKSDGDLAPIADIIERQVNEMVRLLNALSGDHSAEPAATPRTEPNASGATACRRILIVDDNVALLTSLSSVLREAGHNVKTAEDGEQAIPVAVSWNPEFVLLDAHLPGINGFEVAKRLREMYAPQAMTLVLMSGSTLDEATVRGAERAGFDHCIDKIHNFTTLEGLLRRQ
jgi:CheY-like chemotaxis protein